MNKPRKTRHTNESLRSFIRDRRLIHLRTKHPDGTAFDCIPITESESLVSLQIMTDFEPDGIVILPKRVIFRIRNGQLEKAANAIVRHERTIDNVPTPSIQFDRFSTLQELIPYLKAQDIWPAIEIIFRKAGIVYMGPISAISDKSFRLRCYSASGSWTDESEFDYDEVFKVEIQSRYVAHFNSYMRSNIPPKFAKK